MIIENRSSQLGSSRQLSILRICFSHPPTAMALVDELWWLEAAKSCHSYMPLHQKFTEVVSDDTAVGLRVNVFPCSHGPAAPCDDFHWSFWVVISGKPVCSECVKRSRRSSRLRCCGVWITDHDLMAGHCFIRLCFIWSRTCRHFEQHDNQEQRSHIPHTYHILSNFGHDSLRCRPRGSWVIQVLCSWITALSPKIHRTENVRIYGNISPHFATFSPPWLFM